MLYSKLGRSKYLHVISLGDGDTYPTIVVVADKLKHSYLLAIE